MPLSLELMPLEEKPVETPPPKTMVVKFGYLMHIGEFPSDIPHKVGCGTKLVVRTDRGTEIAEMLTTTCSNGGCGKSISRDKLLSYIDLSGGKDYPFTDNGRVLRAATAQDLAEQAKLDEQRDGHLKLAKEMVTRHSLPMKIVEVEHVLGGERVLFYFTSEHRVDFRSLVRDLAHTIHTRIELRQVGARDEARITADYEKCGQHCCCKQFLKVLTPISMKAAKIQKATLDPSKISGRCGRLMCCLRYEDETYEELRKKLPKRNTRVKTEKGDAWVIDGQILTQLVLVMFDDYKREAIPMEKILGFDQPKPLMPDGRVMQSPNDRPPEPIAPVAAPRGPGGPRAVPGGPGVGPRGPGGPVGGPRPMQGGPTGGGPLGGGPIQGGPALGEPIEGGPAMGAPIQGGPGQGAPIQGGPGRGPGPNRGPVPQRPLMQRPPQNNPPRPPQQSNMPQQGSGGMGVPSGGANMPHPLARPLPQGPRPPRAAPFRPRPGNPVQRPQGDPLSTTGPTGGDLNTGAPETAAPSNAGAAPGFPSGPPTASPVPTSPVAPSEATSSLPPTPSTPDAPSTEGMNPQAPAPEAPKGPENPPA